MLSCLNDWSNAIDEENYCDIIYLDIAKAFVTVSTQKLMYKLSYFGLSTRFLRWIESYLIDRHQFVEVDGSASSICGVTSGVPQGSLLGPILFLIYINDICQAVNFSSIKIFADDSKIYLCFANRLDTDLLAADLASISDWASKNQLKIAIQKCSVLHLGRRNPMVEYYLNEQILPAVETVSDLGIEISSNLKSSKHVNLVVNKANKVVNVIFRVFRSRKPSILKKLFMSLVRSKLEYATEVWNPYLMKDIKLLEGVQRNFTRRIPACFGMSYADRLKFLNLESLELRRLHRDLKMTYCILNGLVELKAEEFFTVSLHQATRSNSRKLYMPRFSTDARKYCFAVRVIEPWNSLPSPVVNATNASSFVKKLKACDLSRFLKGGY
jgi:hypothetical protein